MLDLGADPKMIEMSFKYLWFTLTFSLCIDLPIKYIKSAKFVRLEYNYDIPSEKTKEHQWIL